MVLPDDLWWAQCLILPSVSDLSYFLGELEKCVAEPERLGPTFYQTCKSLLILAFICLSVSSKVEQNFILH